MKKETEDFKPLPIAKEIFLKKDDLSDYYINKRKYEYENGLSLKNIKWQTKIHPVLMKLLSFNRKYIEKQTFEITKDLRDGSKPVIYAMTHVCVYDYQIVTEAMGDHQYALFGDPETVYRTLDGLLVFLNGSIYCDVNSKIDRDIAMKRCAEALNNDINVLICPEGLWNVSPNLLMLPIFPGIINLAHETGCDIIPIGVEQYENHFVVSFGERFKVDNLEKSKEMSQEEFDLMSKNYFHQKRIQLRDIMATLKYEIIESQSRIKRPSMGSYEDELKNFVESRLNKWADPKTKEPYYNKENMKEKTFREKGVVFSEDVFAYLKELEYKKETAFCFAPDQSLEDEIIQEFVQKILKKDSH